MLDPDYIIQYAYAVTCSGRNESFESPGFSICCCCSATWNVLRGSEKLPVPMSGGESLSEVVLDSTFRLGIAWDDSYNGADSEMRFWYVAPKSVMISYWLHDHPTVVECRKGDDCSDLEDTNCTPDRSKFGTILDRVVMIWGYGRPALARSAATVDASKFRSSSLRLLARSKVLLSLCRFEFVTLMRTGGCPSEEDSSAEYPLVAEPSFDVVPSDLCVDCLYWGIPRRRALKEETIVGKCVGSREREAWIC